MQIQTTYTVKCCNYEQDFCRETDALEALLNHIKKEHLNIYVNLKSIAMILSSETSNQPSWREGMAEYWMETALKFYIGKNVPLSIDSKINFKPAKPSGGAWHSSFD